MIRQRIVALLFTLGVALALLGFGSEAPTPAPTVSIDGGEGDYTFWGLARYSPVTMYYDPAGEPWDPPDSLITAALTEWNTITPMIQYIYGGRLAPGTAYQHNLCGGGQPDGINSISWKALGAPVLAHACVWESQEECDIELDTATGYLNDAETFRSVLLHESGHCLGLGHSTVAGAVMYPSLTLGTPLHLAADDRAGICALYRCNLPPASPTPTRTPSRPAPTWTPTPTPTRPPTRARLIAPEAARD